MKKTKRRRAKNQEPYRKFTQDDHIHACWHAGKEDLDILAIIWQSPTGVRGFIRLLKGENRTFWEIPWPLDGTTTALNEDGQIETRTNLDLAIEMVDRSLGDMAQELTISVNLRNLSVPEWVAQMEQNPDIEFILTPRTKKRRRS